MYPQFVEVSCPPIVIQQLGRDGRGGGEQESEMNGSEGEAKQEDKV